MLMKLREGEGEGEEKGMMIRGSVFLGVGSVGGGRGEEREVMGTRQGVGREKKSRTHELTSPLIHPAAKKTFKGASRPF